MIGVDTNVLVRFLVQDDPDQGARARDAFGRLTASDPGYLPTLVLAETYWVLDRAYKFKRHAILTAVEDLVATEEIVVQDAGQVASALEAARGGADFADALIATAGAARGCRAVWSFDEAAQATLGFTNPS